MVKLSKSERRTLRRIERLPSPSYRRMARMRWHVRRRRNRAPQQQQANNNAPLVPEQIPAADQAAPEQIPAANQAAPVVVRLDYFIAEGGADFMAGEGADIVAGGVADFMAGAGAEFLAGGADFVSGPVNAADMAAAAGGDQGSSSSSSNAPTGEVWYIPEFGPARRWG